MTKEQYDYLRRVTEGGVGYITDLALVAQLLDVFDAAKKVIEAFDDCPHYDIDSLYEPMRELERLCSSSETSLTDD